MTQAELIRYALKKGRIDPPKPPIQPSELLPTFEDALGMATLDELQKTLAYFIANRKTTYTYRRRRMKRIADELLRRARSEGLP